MRKILARIHIWLGISVGLFWAVQGLTGAMLVFHREADRLSGPVATAGPMVSLDLIAARSAAKASGPIERIAIIDRAGDLLTAEYHDPDGEAHALIVDAATAEIVGQRELEPVSPASGSFSQWLYQLHQSLLRGEEQDAIIGISGSILLVAVVAGLKVAWPRRGAWRATFSWSRWRSVDQRLYGWHRAIGLIAGLILLVTVPCGIYLVFAAEIRPALAAVVPHSLPYKAPSLDATPLDSISPQSALVVAQVGFPEAAFVSLAMPTEMSPTYGIRMRQDEEPRLWAGVTNVIVDAASGRALDVYDPLDAPLSNRIADLLFAIHNGEVGGIGGRIVIMLVGLSLAMLYVIGLWGWWRRKQRRRNNRV